jgi:hypothetical protein
MSTSTMEGELSWPDPLDQLNRPGFTGGLGL